MYITGSTPSSPGDMGSNPIPHCIFCLHIRVRVLCQRVLLTDVASRFPFHAAYFFFVSVNLRAGDKKLDAA